MMSLLALDVLVAGPQSPQNMGGRVPLFFFKISTAIVPIASYSDGIMFDR